MNTMNMNTNTTYERFTHTDKYEYEASRQALRQAGAALRHGIIIIINIITIIMISSSNSTINYYY